ncbi:PDZ family domain protein [Mycobacterium xenopi 4042]|uniref:PDZ family domain protein n=1 Tax=Mycobacterium xenopi 4042 TaxID=1299334 RepID=X7YL31_MYCXE|nr:PDZ family domain protein [Mycobacterium xenopi 4042]EUA33568.1 PDZ family domain protein [Mycobacterium xenopi 3993]
MNRRILTLMVALVPIVVFGVLLAVVTVPYVSLGPGPTFDTLGEVDGKQVVDIQGTQTHPTSGHLNMTTVSQRDELTLGEALTLWLSGREQLVPRDLVYPPASHGMKSTRPTTPISSAPRTAPSTRRWVT